MNFKALMLTMAWALTGGATIEAVAQQDNSPINSAERLTWSDVNHAYQGRLARGIGGLSLEIQVTDSKSGAFQGRISVPASIATRGHDELAIDGALSFEEDGKAPVRLPYSLRFKLSAGAFELTKNCATKSSCFNAFGYVRGDIAQKMIDIAESQNQQRADRQRVEESRRYDQTKLDELQRLEKERQDAESLNRSIRVSEEISRIRQETFKMLVTPPRPLVIYRNPYLW